MPCYNQATRLPVQRFKALTRVGDVVRFLFVDDGSTAATQSVLEGLGGLVRIYLRHSPAEKCVEQIGETCL